MPSVNAPGLKRRKNRDGTERLYWAAPKSALAAGFPNRIVRLHFSAHDPAQHPLIEAACKRLEAEALEWTAGRRETRSAFDGTIASLVRQYQTDMASPYREVKWNTQRTYDQVLGVIEKAFGKRSLAALGISDFRRWYDEAKKPKAPGGSERVRKAHGIISMMRRMFAYGVTAELQECGRLLTILEKARFKQPGRRRQKLESHHVEAFIAKALDAGRQSLALGTALQFETTMRQRDVIGEWEPIPVAESAGGIVLGARRWVRGLTWADISDAFVVMKVTTKTGSEVAHDLTLCPLVMDLLARVPADRRIGPLIVDETAGRPYAEHAYAREWRLVARAAGIPDSVWNMDARAGGISEADDAGADLDAIRSAAGHSQASTTVRYVRGTIGKSRKVAELRKAHRNKS
ncbi:integrase [Xanthobacter autotrophicus DSM 431]|uniref:integrase n=1 Tax=Xanthobacter nonsaccharivorans TaxID=3119912 RepID=UPI003727E2B8